MFHGEITNLDKLKNDFGLADHSDTQDIICHAWQIYGSKLGTVLDGHFAVVIERKNNQTILLTDPVGLEPLYYSQQNGRVYTAFCPKDLLSNPELEFTKNKSWIARYLSIGARSADYESTAYNELQKVPPAHVLVFNGDTLCEKTRTTNWDITPQKNDKGDEYWVQKHRKLLERSISFCLGRNQKVAFENSGGLDSGSISCILANQMNPSQKKNFTAISAQRWHIEDTWISAINHKIGIENVLISDGFNDLPYQSAMNLQVKGYPLSAQPEVSLAVLEQISEQGMQAVFTGFGGDEIVTHHGQGYELEAYENRDFRTLWKLVKGHKLKRPFRFLKMLWKKGDYHNRLLEDEALLDSILSTSFLSQATIEELNLREELKVQAQERSEALSMNGYIKFALTVNPSFQARLEDHTLWGRHFGLDYKWPLLNRHLIENFMTTPSKQKILAGKESRYLHRRAIRGVVPDEIIDTDTKRMGSINLDGQKFYHENAKHCQYAQELLDNLDPYLATIIDPTKLRNALDHYKSQQAFCDDPSAIKFWDDVLKLGHVNYWCQHGR